MFCSTHTDSRFSFVPCAGGSHRGLQSGRLPGVHGEPGAQIQVHGAHRHEEQLAKEHIVLTDP